MKKVLEIVLSHITVVLSDKTFQNTNVFNTMYAKCAVKFARDTPRCLKIALCPFKL